MTKTSELAAAYSAMNTLANKGVLCGIFTDGVLPRMYWVLPEEEADLDPGLIRITPRMEEEVDDAGDEAAWRAEWRFEREYS